MVSLVSLISNSFSDQESWHLPTRD